MILHNADCLQIMPTMAEGSVDLILTDLPYGVLDAHWDQRLDLADFMTQAQRLLKPNGTMVLFGNEPFATDLRMAWRDGYKYDYIWVKGEGSNFLHAKNMPLKKHETILVFSKGKINHPTCTRNRMTYNPQGLLPSGKKERAHKSGDHAGGRAYDIRGALKDVYQATYIQEYCNYPTSILEFGKEGRPLHTSQKPVDLLEYLVKTFTNEGEVVLDATMGSGSTGVACINTGREFVGIELDPEIYNIAENRIKSMNADTLKAA